MTFYIKQWPNGNATLMTDTGAVLWTFTSIDEAKNACRDLSDNYKEGCSLAVM